MIDVRTATEMIAEIDRDGIGLTPWEVGFVDSIQHQLDRNVPLSAKQRSQIEHIHDQRCG